MQSPKYLRSHVSNACMELCLRSSEVLKELANCLKSMTKSSKLNYLIGDMNFAAQLLQDALNALPGQLIMNRPSLLEVVPLVTMMSLLVEISTRIEVLADGVMEFAELAEFKAPPKDKTTAKIRPIDEASRTDETTKEMQKS